VKTSQGQHQYANVRDSHHKRPPQAPKRVAKHAAEHDGTAAPSNADWCHVALYINLATYRVPLTSEAQALPEYDVRSMLVSLQLHLWRFPLHTNVP